MKLQPVAKPDKKIRATSKKFDDDVISENCGNFCQFGAILKLSSGHIVCKTYVLINS